MKVERKRAQDAVRFLEMEKGLKGKGVERFRDFQMTAAAKTKKKVSRPENQISPK